ncbi:transposase [Lutispora sp.]|uniref:transposase n=1 Tax=Lutispora sp. TaxID=2828727 RepID=UPI0035642E62
MLQEALEVELVEKLGYSKYDTKQMKATENSRSRYSKKTVKSQLGDIELNIPRNRNGEFGPQIIPKYQRNVTGIKGKILALYSLGMTTRDIFAKIQDI